MSKPVEYDSLIANITQDENGVFFFYLKNTSAIYNIEETKKQFNFFEQHSPDQPYKVVVDTRDSLVFPTEEALKYYFNKSNPKNKMAIIANSLPMQLMKRQIFKDSSKANNQSFKNKEDAFKWILAK